ncbi:MAG: hypothetical protein LUE17_01685 [Planctomycetaceae bacterium]|nr:hypothetical protein [Planctomycetaceae bacterium]
MNKCLLVVLAFALILFASVSRAAETGASNEAVAAKLVEGLADVVVEEMVATESVEVAEAVSESVISEALDACPVPTESTVVATSYVAPLVLPDGPLEDVYYEVPVTKTIIADEVYTAMEKRTRTVHEVKVKTVKPTSARLARSVTPSRGVTPVMNKEKERQKVYLDPYKEKYEVPVTKTRKIKLQVEEKQLIPASKMKGRRW